MFRVFIVDDELPFVHSLLRYDWQRENCRVAGYATNGQEALEKCGELAPHIVISDINMPVMDGISLLGKLHERYPEIQVILLTVHREFEYARRAVKLGACDYLVKDMEFREQLPAVLQKACAYFERNPQTELDKRTQLMRGSGRMLLIPSAQAATAYCEQIEHFLQAHRCTALGAFELSVPCEAWHQMTQKLDALTDRLDEGTGIIMRRANDRFELTADVEEKNIGQRMSALREAVQAAFGQTVYCVWTPCGKTQQAYEAAHMRCEEELDAVFYGQARGVSRATGASLEALPFELENDWLRTAEAMTGDAELLVQFMETGLAPVIAQARYKPAAIKNALDRVIYRIEARYAERENAQAHQALKQAVTAAAMMDAFQKAVREIFPQGSQYSYPVRQALAYMRQNMGRADLQLSDVAAYVYISPRYLSRRLKEEVGQSFQDALIRMRMEAAAELLRRGNKKVYEVAELTGYENYRSFAAAFSHFWGTSPKKFR